MTLDELLEELKKPKNAGIARSTIKQDGFTIVITRDEENEQPTQIV